MAPQQHQANNFLRKRHNFLIDKMIKQVERIVAMPSFDPTLIQDKKLGVAKETEQAKEHEKYIKSLERVDREETLRLRLKHVG